MASERQKRLAAARCEVAADGLVRSAEQLADAALRAADAFNGLNAALWRHLLDENFGRT